MAQYVPFLKSTTDKDSPVDVNRDDTERLRLTNACKEVQNILLQISKDFPFFMDANLKTDIKETVHVLDCKEIKIGVFGHQNCGKSTLLNVLMKQEKAILPVSSDCETSVKVEIQHDSLIHKRECELRCKMCPVLTVMCPRGAPIEIRGVKDIRCRLDQLNENVRKQSEEPPEYIRLSVCIPSLMNFDKQNANWKVYLIDHPGLGEANEVVSQQAVGALVTSSVYLCLFERSQIRWNRVQNFLKDLLSKDPNAVKDDRLAVIITKMDKEYEDEETDNATLSTEGVETFKSQLKKKIASSLPFDYESEKVILVSARWADCAYQLHSDVNNEKKKKNAISALEKYDFNQEGAQDCSTFQMMAADSPSSISDRLLKASGIHDLNSKIQFVTTRCVKMWKAKVVSNCFKLCENVQTILKDEIKKKEEYISESQTKLQKETCQQEEIYRAFKQWAQVVAKRGKKCHSSSVWKQLKQKCHEDLKQRGIVENIKREVEEVIDMFRSDCRSKYDSTHYGPNEFENDLRSLYTSSELRFQEHFDQSLSFSNMRMCLIEVVRVMVKDITLLLGTAGHFYERKPSCSSATAVQSDEEPKPLAISKTFKLGDIREQVPVPAVSLGILEWLKDYLISFFIWRREGEERHRPTVQQNSSDDDDDDDDDVRNYDIEETHENDDLYEVVYALDSPNSHRKNHQDSGFVVIHPGSCEADRNSDQPEENVVSKTVKSETKALPHTPKSSCGTTTSMTTKSYRKQWEDLSEVIDDVAKLMEKKCIRYLKVVEPHAVQFFYELYRKKTLQELQMFTREYTDAYHTKKKYLSKFKEEIHNNEKQLANMKLRLETLMQRKKKVHDTYEADSSVQC